MSADSDAEVIELRRRLVEAEETLRAIREGEVDALVVRGGRGERVFTLEGGDESYRSFMETMETGAAAIDADGRVLYANNALCQFVGKTLDRLQGHRLSASFGGADLANSAALVAASLLAGSTRGDKILRKSSWIASLSSITRMRRGGLFRMFMEYLPRHRL